MLREQVSSDEPCSFLRGLPLPLSDITMQQAKKELADEEKKEQPTGGTAYLNKMTALTFVTTGLEIEDSQ